MEDVLNTDNLFSAYYDKYCSRTFIHINNYIAQYLFEVEIHFMHKETKGMDR